MADLNKTRPRPKSQKPTPVSDPWGTAGAVTGCGCIGFLVLFKLSLVAAVIYGLVELGLYLSSLH
jgi:hypothetical protein